MYLLHVSDKDNPPKQQLMKPAALEQKYLMMCSKAGASATWYLREKGIGGICKTVTDLSEELGAQFPKWAKLRSA